MAGIFSCHQLEQFFGPYDGNKVGQTNYNQSVEGGVGRYVIAKMLAGTETDDAIRTALENFPMTERRPTWEDCERAGIFSRHQS